MNRQNATNWDGGVFHAFPLQAAANGLLPAIDWWKSGPVSVFEASGEAGIVNAGHRFHQDAEKVRQRP